MTAAAILHDALEDTEVTAEQIDARFGGDVARMVWSLTEDGAIQDERARKSALRDQVMDAERDAAMIYAADKPSRVRELRIRLHGEPAFAGDLGGQRKLDHHWRCLAVLEYTLDRLR